MRDIVVEKKTAPEIAEILARRFERDGRVPRASAFSTVLKEAVEEAGYTDPTEVSLMKTEVAKALLERRMERRET